ncbi:hypothetical protein QOT17_013262 [Balamuthia mandrillaris]
MWILNHFSRDSSSSSPCRLPSQPAEEYEGPPQLGPSFARLPVEMTLQILSLCCDTLDNLCRVSLTCRLFRKLCLEQPLWWCYRSFVPVLSDRELPPMPHRRSAASSRFALREERGGGEGNTITTAATTSTQLRIPFIRSTKERGEEEEGREDEREEEETGRKHKQQSKREEDKVIEQSQRTTGITGWYTVSNEYSFVEAEWQRTVHLLPPSKEEQQQEEEGDKEENEKSHVVMERQRKESKEITQRVPVMVQYFRVFNRWRDMTPKNFFDLVQFSFNLTIDRHPNVCHVVGWTRKATKRPSSGGVHDFGLIRKFDSTRELKLETLLLRSLHEISTNEQRILSSLGLKPKDPTTSPRGSGGTLGSDLSSDVSSSFGWKDRGGSFGGGDRGEPMHQMDVMNDYYKGTLSLEQRLHIARQCVRAVCYLHSRNIFGSCISISNFIVSKELDVKIWNLECHRMEKYWCKFSGDPLEFNFVMLFDPIYSLDQNLDLEKRDAWHLGVVLYLIMTDGEYIPFGLHSRAASIFAATDLSADQLKEGGLPFPLPRIITEGPLSSIITSCLDLHPHKRPSAAQILQQLDQLSSSYSL